MRIVNAVSLIRRKMLSLPRVVNVPSRLIASQRTKFALRGVLIYEGRNSKESAQTGIRHMKGKKGKWSIPSRTFKAK